MVANRTGPWILGGVLILLLCCGGVFGLLEWRHIHYGCQTNRLPLRGADILIDPSDSAQLLTLLEKFAKDNGFTYDEGIYSSNGQDFSIWMNRADFAIIASNTFGPGKFSIGIYNNDCIKPKTAEDAKTLFDELINQLSAVPNIQIPQTK